MINATTNNLTFVNSEESINKFAITKMAIDFSDGISITTATAFTCRPILVNLTVGSKIQISNNHLTLHAAATAGDTVFYVSATTLENPILIGDEVIIDNENLFQQYQFKTEGTISGMPVSSDTLGPIQYTGGRYIGTFDSIRGIDLDFIPIMPQDFVINDDADSPAQFKDGSNTGLQLPDPVNEILAFIRIPVGMKATHVDVWGTQNKNVYVYEMNLNASNNLTTATDLAGGTGVMNTQITLTSSVTSTSTNYLLISVKLTSTSNRIYGGKVTISPA